MLLQNIPQQEFEAKVQQLRQRLEQRNVSAAVGAVWVPHTEDAEALMRQADDRMYRAKETMKQQ